MEPDTKSNLTDRTIWVRILYMLFFAIAYSIAEFLVAVTAIVQALVVLLTGTVNKGLHTFGKNLSVYISQILHFETFNSEELAFPFAEWPEETPDETKWSEQPAHTPSQTSSQTNVPTPEEPAASKAPEVNDSDSASSAATDDEPKSS